MELYKTIDEFKRKHSLGFTPSELERLLVLFPQTDRERFFKGLRNITFSIIDGEDVFYPVDVKNAFKCAIDNRELREDEWD